MQNYRFLFILLIILVKYNSIFSQNYAGFSSIGSATACYGDTILIPVNYSNIRVISAISLAIDYDGSVLSAIQTGNVSAFLLNFNQVIALTDTLTGGIAYAQVSKNGYPGIKQVRISWTTSDTSFLDTNAFGVAHLFDIAFRYLGGTTSLNFDNSRGNGSDCEYSDINGIALLDDPTSLFYSGGNISQATVVQQPGIISGLVTPCTGINNVYSVPPVTNSTFTWTNNIGWFGSSTSNSINYLFSSSASSGTISVVCTNNCGTSVPRTLNITSINSPSYPPVQISGNQGICNGGSSTLTGSCGCTQGTGSVWNWYSNSCGGMFEGSGLSIVVSPTVNTLYYVRVESQCNTTSCLSFEVTINIPSLPDTSISNPVSICQGATTVIGVTGGTLGTGASWNWYNGICGINLFCPACTQLNVTPFSTTVYYVRAEGPCNTTACKSIIVEVSTLSLPSDSISPSSSHICAGVTATLARCGGSTGTSATWVWYKGSCGGTYAGTGDTLVVNSPVSAKYFCRGEGACNTTSCATAKVVVNTFSSPADSVTSSASVVCPLNSVILTVSGGIQANGARLAWYSGSCGGNPEGSGNTLIITPSVTNTYYFRIEGTCNTTACESKTIQVDNYAFHANNIVTVLTTVCSGQASTLTASGGSTGTSGSWNWYAGSCGNNIIGTGPSISVNTYSTTIYFVRAESNCNTTNCISITISVSSGSVGAGSITAASTDICIGGQCNLSRSGGNAGAGGTWVWYTNSCGGNITGTGNALTDAPVITTTYFLRAEGPCNTTSCISLTITVHSLPTVSVSSNSPLCYGDTLYLSASGGVVYHWYGPGGINSNNHVVMTSSFIPNNYYFVTVTSSAGCSATDSVLVMSQPLSSLHGSISSSSGILSSDTATIELFREHNSAFSLVDSTISAGQYNFTNLLPGNYIVRVVLHGNNYPAILPTYYDSTYQWSLADTIQVSCNSSVTRNIRMYELTSSSSGGPGLVSGNIFYRDSLAKSGTGTAKGVLVVLVSMPGNKPVKVCMTNSAGYYSFSNVPLNSSYSLHVEIPFLPMISTFNFHMTQSEHSFSHMNFIVDSSGNNKGIYSQHTTGIKTEHAKVVSLTTYPNPFNSILNIECKVDKPSMINIDIMDINGNDLGQVTREFNIQGSGILQIDLSNKVTQPGIYILKIQTGDDVYYKKVVHCE